MIFSPESSNMVRLKMEQFSDIELVAQAKEGSSEAFSALASRHYETVYRTAFKWRPVKEDAEDIAQEVFVKLAKAIHGFKGQSAFKTWLYRVTMNSAKDFGRKSSNKQRYEEKFAEEAPNTSSDSISEAKANPMLQKALDRLSDKLKDALLLVVSEELSHKEASKILDCSVATVAWRVFEAKKQLKEILGKSHG